MTDRNPEYSDERQGLIDELQSVSTALGPPDPDAAAAAHGQIPVLLDVVDVQPVTRATADATATRIPAPGVDAHTALEIEARSILDDLIDEFLPIIEARMRDRLEDRMRQLLAARPDAAPEG